MFDLALEISGYSLEPANCNWFCLDASAATRGLARPVTSSTQNTREDVGIPIDHIRVGISSSRNQADIFWDWRMRRTGILAIYNLMKIFWIFYVGWVQGLNYLSRKSREHLSSINFLLELAQNNSNLNSLAITSRIQHFIGIFSPGLSHAKLAARTRNAIPKSGSLSERSSGLR